MPPQWDSPESTQGGTDWAAPLHASTGRRLRGEDRTLIRFRALQETFIPLARQTQPVEGHDLSENISPTRCDRGCELFAHISPLNPTTSSQPLGRAQCPDRRTLQVRLAAVIIINIVIFLVLSFHLLLQLLDWQQHRGCIHGWEDATGREPGGKECMDDSMTDTPFLSLLFFLLFLFLLT